MRRLYIYLELFNLFGVYWLYGDLEIIYFFGGRFRNNFDYDINFL